MNKSYLNKQSPKNGFEFKCQRSDYVTGKYTRSQRYKYAVLFSYTNCKNLIRKSKQFKYMSTVG